MTRRPLAFTALFAAASLFAACGPVGPEEAAAPASPAPEGEELRSTSQEIWVAGEYYQYSYNPEGCYDCSQLTPRVYWECNTLRGMPVSKYRCTHDSCTRYNRVVFSCGWNS